MNVKYICHRTATCDIDAHAFLQMPGCACARRCQAYYISVMQAFAPGTYDDEQHLCLFAPHATVLLHSSRNPVICLFFCMHFNTQPTCLLWVPSALLQRHESKKYMKTSRATFPFQIKLGGMSQTRFCSGHWM